MKFPWFYYYADCVEICRQAQPFYANGVRYGQAVANKYELPSDLEQQIYQSDDFSFVCRTIFQYFKQCER